MTAQTPSPRLKAGDRAPTVEVQGPGGPVPLGSYWANGPVVVAFLRHLG